VANIDPEAGSSLRFKSTCWTVVADAASMDSPEAPDALAELCQTYWYPLYAFRK
jgi:RNA polymerase sigma-70 factor (ECF subfamily)